MASIADFYKIPIELEAFTTANFLAEIRIKYEYQRTGHNYNYNIITNELKNIANIVGFNGSLSLGNIAFGILSEILIYGDLTNYLKTNYLKDNLIPNQIMINQNFEYNLTIGAYDKGFDYTKTKAKTKYEMDVKHYSTHICQTDKEILRLKLLVDQKQYKNHQADIYIQSFTLIENNKPYIVIAGYATKNMLTLNSQLPNPAYCCSVSQLLTYDDLKKQYF